MSGFETAITNLVKNLSLDEEKKNTLLALARNKRTSANKRWLLWVFLFLIVVMAFVFSLHYFGYTKASFKAVGAGLGVIGAFTDSRTRLIQPTQKAARLISDVGRHGGQLSE